MTTETEAQNAVNEAYQTHMKANIGDYLHDNSCFCNTQGKAIKKLEQYLLNGDVRQVLRKDRISRNIIRVLCTDFSPEGCEFHGGKVKYPISNPMDYGFIFPQETDRRIFRKIDNLEGMGILMHFENEGDERFCLQTEYKCGLYLSNIRDGDYETRKLRVEVMPNKNLRKSLIAMMSPHELEEPVYDLKSEMLGLIDPIRAMTIGLRALGVL